MNKMLEGMEKFICRRGSRKTYPYLSISKSGWATIRDGLAIQLNVNKYNSVDFFIKPNDKERNIAFVLYKDNRGELCLRHRKSKPNPVGCGFCVIRLVRRKPEYISLYEVEKTQVGKDNITVLLKPLKSYV